MESASRSDGKRVLLRASAFAIALSLIVVATATTVFQAKTEKKHMAPFNDLLSEQPRTRDQAAKAILQDRKSIIEQLSPLIDPANAKKYSDETRSAAAYLLGQYRAVEGVPVLAKALADPPGLKDSSDKSFYVEPVFNALVKIGREAVPGMIEIIETSDHAEQRKGSMFVLLHVLGGKRRLLETLTKLLDRRLKERPMNQEVVRRIREAHTWAKSYFKDEEEPLY